MSFRSTVDKYIEPPEEGYGPILFVSILALFGLMAHLGKVGDYQRCINGFETAVKSAETELTLIEDETDLETLNNGLQTALNHLDEASIYCEK